MLNCVLFTCYFENKRLPIINIYRENVSLFSETLPNKRLKFNYTAKFCKYNEYMYLLRFYESEKTSLIYYHKCLINVLSDR